MQRRIKLALFLSTSVLVSLASVVSLSLPSIAKQSYVRHSLRLSQQESKKDAKNQVGWQTDKSTASYLRINDGVVQGFKEGFVPSKLNLFIPSRTKNGNVVEIAPDAFAMRKEIKTVEIEEGVSKIGNNAFLNCSNLEKIIIPASVVTIGESTLSNCNLLKSEDVVNNSEVLFDWWAENHLYHQKTLQETEIIDLNNCLNSAQKPFSTIATKAFANCWLTKSITFSSSIDYIATSAFYSSTPIKLNSVHFETNQIYLEWRSLDGLENNCDFYVHTTAMAFKLKDRGAKLVNIDYGDFYVKRVDKEVYLSALTNEGKTNSTLTVPVQINRIDANAFRDCNHDLKTVVMECFDAKIAENTLETLNENVQFEVFSRRMKNRLINSGVNPVRIKLTNMHSKPSKGINLLPWRPATAIGAYQILLIVSSTFLGLLVVGLTLGCYFTYRRKKINKDK